MMMQLWYKILDTFFPPYPKWWDARDDVEPPDYSEDI